jgi:hypothetical protein
LAFRSNFFGAITHRGGRDARVPVHAASRQLSATPTGTVWNINAFHAPTVGEYADATAQRSVAHLTITNVKKDVWYNEGGMPAFQSAPLRGYCRRMPTGDGLEYQHDSRTIASGQAPVANIKRIHLHEGVRLAA